MTVVESHKVDGRHVDSLPSLSGRSIAVIGSFRRYYDQVVAAAEVFAAAGLEVKSPSRSRIINHGESYVRFESDPPDVANQDIQRATLGRILEADAVYVVAPGGYLGRDTSVELGYVLAAHTSVYFSDHPVDVTLVVGPDVMTPTDLIEHMRRMPGPGGPPPAARDAGSLLNPPGSRPRADFKMTADLVIFTIREDSLRVLLVRRGKPPYKDKLALPGGFLRLNEDLETAAHRELLEETGLDSRTLRRPEQLRTYSRPGRDPRGPIVTTAFLVIAPDLPQPLVGSDAAAATWAKVDDDLYGELAFDHAEILRDGLERAAALLEQTTVAAAFCAEPFTLPELRRVYALVWGESYLPDERNFQRKMIETEGFLVDTGERRAVKRGRPPRLYRRGDAERLHPPLLRRPGESIEGSC